VGEPEPPGVEHLAWIVGAASVNLVAQDWIPEVFEVDADLVGAPCVQRAFHETCAGQFAQDAVVGGGRSPPACFHNGHFLAVNRVPPDGCLHGAGFFRKLSSGKREIDFQGFAGCELQGKPLVGSVVLGDDDAAAGFLVESVNDAGALFAADAGEVFAMVEQGIDERSGGIPCCRVDDHSGGFVENDKVVVFVENFQRDFLRGGAGDRRGFGFVDSDVLAGPEFFPWLDLFAFHENMPFLDQRLEARPGEVRELGREKMVQAKAGSFRGGEEFRHGEKGFGVGGTERVAHRSIIGQSSSVQSLSPRNTPMSTEAEPLVHTCPSCGALLDVSEIEPFTEVNCPTCNTSMRVRTQFDHFELLEFLASGGMGTVYKARDLNLNRIIALKLMRKEFSEDAEYIAKLETEAKLTASVAHPFVVQVFSFGCDQGVYYIAMELVDKGSLDDLMTLQGRVAEAQVLEIGIQVAQGLRAAYRVGLIHRDVKPGNILFADSHTAKVVDFGLAMPLEKAKEGEEEIWGTPYYVAPEKLNHEPEDFRSDIYSLGGTLFHAVAGRPPFEALNASLVALKHLKSQAVSLQAFAPDVSSPTAYVINRTLAKNPDDRYQSYDELIEHLEYARSQLLENAGKARQPKARVVVEDEKQQSVLSSIILAMIAFTLILGVILYIYKDKIINRNTGAEDLARQQMEHSYNTVEQAMTAVRKQTVAGEDMQALKTLQTLQSRANFTEAVKCSIGLHECIVRLDAGQFWLAGNSIAKLSSSYDPRMNDRNGGGESWRRFLQVLTYLLQTRGEVSDAAMKNWATEQFEPAGLLIGGLKEWDASRFEQASALFQRFLATKPKGDWAWIEDFKPLAQGCMDDYKTFQVLETLIAIADTPEKKATVLKEIPKIKEHLKRHGRLRDELSLYEAVFRIEPVPSPENGSAVSPAMLSERVTRMLEAMQPAEAQKEINTTPLVPNDLVVKVSLIKKAGYIADLKKLLIEDLNRFNSNRRLARRSGPVLVGRISKVDDAKIEIESDGSVVAVPWSDVMPSTIMVWSDSVAGSPETTSRIWLSGVYASVAGFSNEAKGRLMRGAELGKQYAKDIPLIETAP